MGRANLDRGLRWLEKLLRLESRYGFFALLRTLVLLLFFGLAVFIITSPRYFVERAEGYIRRRHDAAVSMRLVADAEARVVLSRLIAQTECSRAWVIELHNGTENLATGLPFLYGDMRLEEVSPGAGNVDREYRDFPLGRYPMATHLIHEGVFIGGAASVRAIDERLYHKLKANGVEAVGMVTLYAGARPLGVLGVSFGPGGGYNPAHLALVLQRYGVQVGTILSRGSE